MKRLTLESDNTNGPPVSSGGMNTPRQIRQVLSGPFKSWLGDDDWKPWIAALKAMRGEKLTKTEAKLFRECTKRKTLPTEPFLEAYLICGRRARKSAAMAMLATYFSIYGRWKAAPGEELFAVVVAVSKSQAAIVKNYCEGILRSNPALERLIVGTPDHESIKLEVNGQRITILCVSNSYRKIRGRSIIFACLEELAFWWDEASANPDLEVYRSIVPSMASNPQAVLVGISSPYSKRGLLYDQYKDNFAKDKSDVLVWQAASKVMNPGLSDKIIKSAYKKDAESARAEYGGHFRDDIASFIDREALDPCIEKGLVKRAPESRQKYFAFVDPSGGRNDSMVLAIAHEQGDKVLLDAIQERRPPFSPESCVEEFCELLKAYGIRRIRGDRYAGEWPREQFKKRGIDYFPADKPKSALYLEMLAPLNSGRLKLIEHDRLINQLCNLERRTARGGKDSVDHGPGQHDDVANAVAGVINEVIAESRRPKRKVSLFGPKLFSDRSNAVDLTYDRELRTFHDYR